MPRIGIKPAYSPMILTSARLRRGRRIRVEDLLPRAEVQLTAGDGDHDFAAHDRALEMRVGIVLGTVVGVLRMQYCLTGSADRSSANVSALPV